jgi:hypothetical protein
VLQKHTAIDTETMEKAGSCFIVADGFDEKTKGEQ